MTPPDHDPPFDDDIPLDDDALAVQAVVDDEATAEQRRRVARDPELVAQVAALREAIAAVAAPVEPPPADVLAALRARALDAPEEAPAPGEADGSDPADDGSDLTVAPVAPAPVRDLGAARARRSRSLPPLPAVAAVVILLVVVGVGLLIAGSGGKDADTASSNGPAAEATTGADDSGGGEAGSGGDQDLAESEEGQAADSEDATNDGASEGPSAQFRDELLEQARARYATDAELVDALEEVDVDTLALSDSTTASGGGDDQPAATTTTTPPDTHTTARSAASYAADPAVTRCDDVLRSAEPELEPVTAAVIVDVDDVPVLVLSNPVEVSDRAPSGVRLTILNAIDCSPRAAVLR